MKRLALTCMLLCFGATSSVAGPAPQNDGQTSVESKCSHGFRECKESLDDFKEAERFMRLKASVFADVNGLEKPGRTKPKIAGVGDADENRRKTENAAAYRATVGPNKMSSVQATNAVQPVSLESAAGTPRERR